MAASEPSGRVVIHRSRHAQQYVVIANVTARDARLSFRARGLLVMLLSMPGDWAISAASLAEDNPEGRDAIRTALRELRDAGYAKYVKERDERMRWRTRIEIFDTPQAEFSQVAPETDSQAPEEVNPQVAPETDFQAPVSPETDFQASAARASPQVAPETDSPAPENQAPASPKTDFQAPIEVLKRTTTTRTAAQSAAPPAKKEIRRGTRIPSDFGQFRWVTPEIKQWMRDRCPLVSPSEETEIFCNYWESKAGRDAMKTDWIKTWMNWMLKTQRESATRRRPAPRTDPNRDY